MSPLAERIYQTLVRQLRSSNPLISYGDLVKSLGTLPPPYTDLKPNDPRLFEALGEIHRACDSHTPPLPALTSITVGRREDGRLGTPGRGYFAVVFPQIRDEKARAEMWRKELKRVISCLYPEKLTKEEFPLSREPRLVSSWLREPAVIAAMIGVAGTVLGVIIPIWLANHRAEPSLPRQAERVVVQIVPTIAKPSEPPEVVPSTKKTGSQTLTLEKLLDVLERHHQRATFGAVGELLERDPRSPFNGYVRTPRTAWVVNKGTGLPTGTKAADYPPGLLETDRVIDSADELRAWVLKHP